MIVLGADRARQILLRATGLNRPLERGGLEGVLVALDHLGCVQLDPLDRVGTNADLVLHARVPGLRRGDWSRAMPRHAFEHFAKERCLLPARLFPCYRERAHQAPWWRLHDRLKRLPQGVLDEVLAELTERGPLAPRALSHRGKVDALDWNGWKGTSDANSMALEVLWTRCLVVTAGRTARGERIYDVPARALPEVCDAPALAPDRTLLIERARGAGLLSTAQGPHWSMLSEHRNGPLMHALIKEGALVKVEVEGRRRSYLTVPEHLDAPPEDPDDRMRVLGPLDPLLWDRKLVEHVFGFDYIWEVYKPAALRQWGYYVTPLLYHGRLVGRIEARRVTEGKTTRIEVEKRWGEVDPAAFDEAMQALLEFQERAC